MFLVEKLSLNNKIPLLSYQKDILKNPQNYTIEQRKTLAHHFLKMKETHWIACDCNDLTAIIVVCRRNNGDIYLRRRSKSEHEANCIFSQEDLELSPNTSASYIPSRSIKTFCIYFEAANFLTSSSKEGKNQNVTRNVSRLGQLLYTLLHESGANVMTRQGENLLKKEVGQAQYEAIKEILKEKNITKNISLFPFVHYTLTEKSLKFAEFKLLNPDKVIGRPWPSHIKPFVLFLTKATYLSSHHFSHPSFGKIKVDSPIQTTSPWINKIKSSPYLILSSFTLDENNVPIFRDAFAIPVLSEKEVMPLESSYERSILKLILGVISTIPEKEELKVEKPLFCYLTSESQKYRPDFILYGKAEKKIFIEVLGSRDEEYLIHKAYIGKAAKDYCNHFITVKAYELQKEYESFKAQLTNALIDILR